MLMVLKSISIQMFPPSFISVCLVVYSTPHLDDRQVPISQHVHE